MADTIVTYLRSTLPHELADLTRSYLSKLEAGDYQSILQTREARILFGHDAPEDSQEKLQSIQLQDFPSWNDYLFHRLGVFLAHRSNPELQTVVFCIGYAALLAFVQSTVTGPPLNYRPADLVLPPSVVDHVAEQHKLRQTLLASLTVDGIAAYKLTPNIELLSLADAIMTCPAILKNVKPARWIKMRVAFFHQRLLSEVSSTLQHLIYDDLDLLEDALAPAEDKSLHVEFLLERASIHIHHGLDKLARQDLEQAKKERHFEFALIGMLGKRTKFQQRDISQLVVLAKSAVSEEVAHPDTTETNETQSSSKPENLDLNDDTLLESISFTKPPTEQSLTEMKNLESLPLALRGLEAGNQPQLQAIDSTLLLLLASSITNTAPQNGLTREETLPYATRVLDGGSSNWQVYTQALLVRSRIEGYKSRTMERGLLQLQALVDQVIADTTSEGSSGKEDSAETTTTTSFLPKPKESESAPVTERLRYVFQLATPTRWELEAELAARWVQMGGLRSALDIYERLEMWAEAALCWAATDREDKAKRIVRRQLFHATDGGPEVLETDVDDAEEWRGSARDPPPLDAPRLYCILGDIDQSIEMYEEAWKVSKERYARAQRSIGRHFYSAKDMVRAAEAYAKSLKVNQLNQPSWFALGCAYLELAHFHKAVEAFSRCVQLDDTDAESWSNLAAALLRTHPDDVNLTAQPVKLDDDDEDQDEDNSAPATITDSTPAQKTQHLRLEALKALHRAATLKHDSFRIWENLLLVASSLQPPAYDTMLSALRQILQLRGPHDGDRCLDVDILSLLVDHVLSLSESYDPEKPGLQRMVVKFLDADVVPRITASAELWRLMAKVAVWRDRPGTALDAEEKAWRVVTNVPGWDTVGGGAEAERKWGDVVEATVRLCDGYESLGPKLKTEGMAAGSGEVVMKDWKFKARSAVRAVMGRAKDCWEGTEGWERLSEVMKELKG